MKFLIVKLSAIGDVIHALPVPAYLKRAVPGCTISWLVEKASADLVSNNPAIDEVIVFGGKKWFREFGQPGTWLKNANEASQFFQGLRDAKYDAVLELQGLLKSSLLARASGAKVVAGFDDTREFADRFLTHKLDVGDYFGHDVPVVELNLSVAKFALKILNLPAPELPVEFSLPELPSTADVKVLRLLNCENSLIPGAGSIPNAAPAPNQTSTPGSVSAPNQTSKPGLAPAPNQTSTPGSAPATNQTLTPGSAPAPNPESAPALSPTSTPAGAPAIEPTSTDSAPARFSTPIPDSGSLGDNTPYIVLIPGTTWITKIWPETKWIELGEKLARTWPCRLVLIGGPAESRANAAIMDGIAAKCPEQIILNLTGKTTLLELINVFRRSALVIGGDTGPLHLAAATGVPKIVGVFGSTPARRNGPYGAQCQTVHLNLDCQPCYSKTCRLGTVACLIDLSSDQVMNAAINALA